MSGNDDLIDVFLQPGDLFVGDDGFRIRTILGSCVSITLWHPVKRMGGMSHFLLPTRGTPVCEDELDGRYGDEALHLIIRDLRQAGISPLACQAKVFGGGNMFPEHMKASAGLVGQRNGEAARQMLRSAGIQIVSESLFGSGHRQIIFDIRNGDVWSRQVKPSALEAAAEEKLR
jgi:chemotaxis protein CheD